MHTHMIKYNQKGVEEALESLKTGYGSTYIYRRLKRRSRRELTLFVAAVCK